MKRCALCHGKLGLGIAPVICGTDAGGLTLASARLVAKVITSWSVTTLTPNNIAGTPSSIVAVRRANVFARDGDTGG
jgi:hypothetical protein